MTEGEVAAEKSGQIGGRDGELSGTRARNEELTETEKWRVRDRGGHDERRRQGFRGGD